MTTDDTTPNTDDTQHTDSQAEQVPAGTALEAPQITVPDGLLTHLDYAEEGLRTLRGICELLGPQFEQSDALEPSDPIKLAARLRHSMDDGEPVVERSLAAFDAIRGAAEDLVAVAAISERRDVLQANQDRLLFAIAAGGNTEAEEIDNAVAEVQRLVALCAPGDVQPGSIKPANSSPGAITAATMLGDLVSAVVDELKAAPDVWQKTPQHRQQEAIDRITGRCRAIVAQAVRIIAADARPTVVATVEQVTAKDGLKAVLTIPRTCPSRHDIVDAVGSTVMIVIADSEQYSGGQKPKAEGDQKPLFDGDE